MMMCFWFYNRFLIITFQNLYLILMMSKLFHSKCFKGKKSLFSEWSNYIFMIKWTLKTLYTFLALIELICERPSKTPANKKKMMTFEWYTVCFMSTLSHDKSTLDTNGTHTHNHLYFFHVCGLIPSPQKVNLIRIIIVYGCVKHDIFLIWDKISHQILIYFHVQAQNYRFLYRLFFFPFAFSGL